MRLFCAIGWHRAISRDRWNRGYYFSKCRSCGRDLVRTSAGRWHVPKGYRVVWKPKPAADADWVRWLQERQMSEDMQRARLVSILLPAVPTISYDEIVSAVRIEQAIFSAPGGDQPSPHDDPPSEPVEQTMPQLEAGKAGSPKPVPSSADADLIEGTGDAGGSLATSDENPPAHEEDFMDGAQDCEQVGPLPISMSEREIPAPRASALRAAMDDFMNDDGESGAWSAPHPVQVELPDFEEDFMADRDDRDHPAATMSRRSDTIDAAEEVARDPNEIESENKVKKARRSRKKAAES